MLMYLSFVFLYLLLSSELAFNIKHNHFFMIGMNFILYKGMLVVYISNGRTNEEDLVDYIGGRCPKNPQEQQYC